MRTALLISAWLALVSVGFGLAFVYAQTPGASAHGPASWPEEVPLERPDDRPTVLVFAHPRCPCTVATFAELERVLTSRPEAARVVAAFATPEDADEAWRDDVAWKRAARVPGLERRVDPGGELARRFGAHTSGQVLVYRSDGSLAFDGGVTVARGHEGPNPGIDALASLLDEQAPRVSTVPVFGCELVAGAPAVCCSSPASSPVSETPEAPGAPE